MSGGKLEPILLGPPCPKCFLKITNSQFNQSKSIADVIAYKGFKPGIFFSLYLVSAKSDRLL